jgi:hypothetical protein
MFELILEKKKGIQQHACNGQYFRLVGAFSHYFRPAWDKHIRIRALKDVVHLI